MRAIKTRKRDDFKFLVEGSYQRDKKLIMGALVLTPETVRITLAGSNQKGNLKIHTNFIYPAYDVCLVNIVI